MRAPRVLVALAVSAASLGCATQKLEGSSPFIRWEGRVDVHAAGGPRFALGGTAFSLRFAGQQVSVRLREGPAQIFEKGQRYQNRFRVELDGAPVAAPLAPATVDTAADWQWTSPRLPSGEHTLVVSKETEALVGEAQLLGIEVTGRPLAPLAPPARRLEFIGDSHTAGFGALGAEAGCPFSSETESQWNAFSAVAARALFAEAHFVAFSGRGLTRNYDDERPPELVPALWRATLAPGFEPDAVVLLVGPNDFGRGDPGEGFVAAYAAFLEEVRRARPHAYVLALSHARRTALTGYVQRAVEARRAAGDQRLGLAELPARRDDEGVGCVGHSTAATHRRHSEVLVQALEAALGWAPAGAK